VLEIFSGGAKHPLDPTPSGAGPVTHPGTNRAWHTATTLIETNALPLSYGYN